MSQSPQTGQFNSYKASHKELSARGSTCLNPLKRVNSILTNSNEYINDELYNSSQSPQTGQFNSYSMEIGQSIV